MKRWQIFLIVTAVSGSAAMLVSAERRRHTAEMDAIRADLLSVSRSAGEGSRDALQERGFQKLVSLVREVPAHAPAPAAKETPTEPPHAAAEKPRPLEPTEVRDRLEGRFSQERAEPKWSTEAQQLAETRLPATLPPSSSLRSVDCRGSMCRIETSHQDLEHYRQFVHKAFLTPATHLWNGGFFSTLIDDPGSGTMVAVAFLGRDGEALPNVQ